MCFNSLNPTFHINEIITKPEVIRINGQNIHGAVVKTFHTYGEMNFWVATLGNDILDVNKRYIKSTQISQLLTYSHRVYVITQKSLYQAQKKSLPDVMGLCHHSI